MKKKTMDVRQMVLLAMLGGILLVMSFTPLGYLNIGPLAISLNMIPVAIGAMALGPKGGAFLGGVFGLTSFLQCIGVGGTSLMGVALFEISPVLAFVQRFFPRLLAGWLSGLIYQWLHRATNGTVAGFVTGFAAALMNTVLFMAALLLLFGNSEYLRSLIGGRNLLVFVCAFVGINAIVEMVATTAVVGALGGVLDKIRKTGR